MRGETDEVLRQASTVLGRPVTLWEVTGPGDVVARASTDPALAGSVPSAPPRRASLDLDATLRRWNVPIPVGSRWVAAATPAAGWVIAPVRSRAPAPPPNGRERRSRERLALELAGLAVGLIDGREGADADAASPLRDLASLPAMIAHEASNPLAAARAGLQLAMEAASRWMEIGADHRLMLLDELAQVVADIDRATEFLRAVQDRARGALVRSERFDVVRVVRACLTLERRLLHERGLELRFNAEMEAAYLKGDPNAFFDVVVNLVRNAADASASGRHPVDVHLTQTERQIELTVSDRGAGIAPEILGRIFDAGFTTKEFGKGSGMGLAKVRTVAEGMFGGAVAVDSRVGEGATFTVTFPLPPQRGTDPRREPPSP